MASIVIEVNKGSTAVVMDGSVKEIAKGFVNAILMQQEQLKTEILGQLSAGLMGEIVARIPAKKMQPKEDTSPRASEQQTPPEPKIQEASREKPKDCGCLACTLERAVNEAFAKAKARQ